MKTKSSPTIHKVVVFLIAAVFLVDPIPAEPNVMAATTNTTDTACRFGINVPLPITGYDLVPLGIGSVLDWGAVDNPSLPPGMEYIGVLRLRDDLFQATLANLPTWVQDNPGRVWIVGNEPDTTYENQDALLPEVYADRYYALATIIRQMDRTAQIGFGTVVQPTPIRMRYLQRAWNRLIMDAGNTLAASSLVDIWTPHSFILNEEEGSWGTGIPPGFENDHGDAVIITDFNDTFSINIFMQRIIDFRAFMASLDERNKPLWITEYGSLFPPIDPPGGPDYYNVSDESTSLYMLSTFNFLLTASEHQTGLPADNNQLVQRWYWYSLNDHRYHFGGSVYNPDYPEFGPLITPVGESLITHQAMNLVPPDLFPQSLSIVPISYNQDPSLVDYKLDISIANNEFNDATCGQLSIYDGDPDNGGALIIGPVPASAFHADYGDARITTYWIGAEPLTAHNLCVVVDSIGVADTVPGNNKACFNVNLKLPELRFLPFVYH